MTKKIRIYMPLICSLILGLNFSSIIEEASANVITQEGEDQYCYNNSVPYPSWRLIRCSDCKIIAGKPIGAKSTCN